MLTKQEKESVFLLEYNFLSYYMALVLETDDIIVKTNTFISLIPNKSRSQRLKDHVDVTIE